MKQVASRFAARTLRLAMAGGQDPEAAQQGEEGEAEGEVVVEVVEVVRRA